MKHVLVTGAAGLIGGSLCTLLSEKDYIVHALDRSERPPLGLPHNIWIQYDLAADPVTSLLPKNVDVVVHLAQSPRFREFPEGSRDVVKVNTLGTLDMLEYARNAGARQFILASSGAVYGSGDRPFRETDPVTQSESFTVYQTSKLAAELLADAYGDFFTTTKLRFFFVYGPGQRDDMLIPRLAERVRHGLPVFLDGEEGMRINPVYAGDAAAAIERAIEGETGGVFNIGGGEEMSIRQIAESLGEQIGKRPVFERRPDSYPHDIIGDVTKMSTHLVAPRISFKTGIRKMFSSHQGD